MPTFGKYVEGDEERAALNGLGAVGDDPKALIALARDRAKAALTAGNWLAHREAANLGYLAICAVADNAAALFGAKVPEGAKTREALLFQYEDTARLGSRLSDAYNRARFTLHGAYFHGNEASVRRTVENDLAEIAAAIDAAVASLPKVKKALKVR